MTEKVGTPYYIAPEVLNKNYGPKCDIWSTGVIAYILLSGCPPFGGNTDNDIMKCVRGGKVTYKEDSWAKVSDQCKEFITSLLTYNQD